MERQEQLKMDWFKIHHNGWLEGTLRSQPNIDGDKLAAYRGIFADLCALISRSRLRDGTLRRQIGQAMERQWIANVLNISLGLLNEVVEFGKSDINPDTELPMIKEWEDGTLELTGWQRYQVYKKSAKQLRRERAIENNVERVKREDKVLDGVVQATNRMNIVAVQVGKKLQYIPDGDDILNTETAELTKRDKGVTNNG